MRTYPILAKDGSLFAFEIENVYLPWTSTVAKILSRAEGVSGARRATGGDRVLGDNRFHFEYRGVSFKVSEPFGDNSRYWVGPNFEGASRPLAEAEVAAIMRCFVEYKPSLLLRLLGTITTLNLDALRPTGHREGDETMTVLSRAERGIGPERSPGEGRVS